VPNTHFIYYIVKHKQIFTKRALLSQLHRWEESHDSAPYTSKLSRLAGSITPRLPLVAPPCLSLRCTPLVHPAQSSMSLAFTFFLCLWLCTLCSYMDSKGHLCETSCLLGVSCPFTNHHTQTNHRHPFMDPVHPNKPIHPSTITSLGPTHPILGCTPLALCSSLCRSS
jgi:hypothetical protein